MALSGISVTSMPYWRAIPAARSGETAGARRRSAPGIPTPRAPSAAAVRINVSRETLSAIPAPSAANSRPREPHQPSAGRSPTTSAQTCEPGAPDHESFPTRRAPATGRTAVRRRQTQTALVGTRGALVQRSQARCVLACRRIAPLPGRLESRGPPALARAHTATGNSLLPGRGLRSRRYPDPRTGGTAPESTAIDASGGRDSEFGRDQGGCSGGVSRETLVSGVRHPSHPPWQYIEPGVTAVRWPARRIPARQAPASTAREHCGSPDGAPKRPAHPSACDTPCSAAAPRRWNLQRPATTFGSRRSGASPGTQQTTSRHCSPCRPTRAESGWV